MVDSTDGVGLCDGARVDNGAVDGGPVRPVARDRGGLSRTRAVVLGLAASAIAASVALAQGPPPMTDVAFPIDTASIGTKVAAAGAAILLIVFGYKIGFSMVKRLLARVKSAI